MDNTIRPVSTPTAGPVAAPQSAPRQPEAAPLPQDSVTLGTSQPPAAAPPQAPPQPEAPAQPQAPPAPMLPPEHPQGFVNVPVTLAVPVELTMPDEHGNIPLSQYSPTLAPPNAIYTTQEHIQELVETVKKQTLPPGTHPEIDMSAGGHKIDVAMKTFSKVATSVGGIATYSLAREGASFTIPAAVAGPIALGVGGLAIYAGLDQAKQGLNLKGYYEGLQKEGVQALPMQVPVRGENGMEMQTVEVPIDKMIGSAKDAAVVGGAQALSGAFMLGAGICMLAALPAAPALAIGSIVLSVAGPLYAARGQLAMVAQAAWSKIKEKLHIGHKEGGEQQRQEPTVDPAQASKLEPTQRTEPTLTTEQPKT